MTAPWLTIAIMAFNRPRTLREALDSILPQLTDLPDVEVLISDNASGEATGEVGREYAERHPRVRYTRNASNLGFDGNVVACLEKASGAYVCFFSDDDLFPPGTIRGIHDTLRQHQPAILYINHMAFYHDNPSCHAPPAGPVTVEMTQEGRDYFIRAGLGFLSALTLKREEACAFIGKVVRGRGTAHLDIAARVAALKPGPFIYDGRLAVLARYDLHSPYDVLRFGPLNVALLHHELRRENLLTERQLRDHLRRSIRLFLPRCILNNRLKGTAIVSRQEMAAVFAQDPLFYVYAWPLLILPPRLVRILGLPLRAVMRWRRRVRYPVTPGTPP